VANRWIPFSTLLLLAACDADSPERTSGASDCSGAKCDLPDQDADTNCRQRRSEVLDSSQRAFTEDSVRWACADVAGVNTVGTDDRGQEYCEYYAIFAPGGDAFDVEPTPLGRQLSAERGDVSPLSVCVEGDAHAGCGVTLSEDAMFALEDEPDAVVGSCMFTSWHSDVPGPLASCQAGQAPCPTVHGFPMDEEFGRMKLVTNSNATSSDVVQFCVDAATRGLTLPPDFEADPDDPFTDAFYRGCRLTGLFDLEWRRSDPAICAATNRMVECGCELPGVATEDIGKTVVPPQPRDGDPGEVTFRGFSLGSWSGPTDLPAGCEALDTGEAQRTIVRCDLLAADVLEHLNDPKEACRQTYGQQVVAYAPVPVEQIRCTESTDAAGAACGSMPWNIGRENG
jgi:hypothetical protein